MSKFKKLLFPLFIIALLMLAACGGDNNKGNNNNANDNGGEGSNNAATDYPEKNINGIIMWGEGGATDIIGRTLAPMVEEELGGKFVMQNKAGAAGAIATQYVYDQPADGYNVLFGAENPNLYQVLDISDRSYQEDFVPISVIANSFAGIIVRDDSPFETLTDFVEYAQENPNELIFGAAGEGSLPSVAQALIQNELGVELKSVPYDGEGPIATALLGGEVDISAVTVSAATEYVESGDFRMLSVIHNEKLEALPEVPTIIEEYPEMEKFLPWGPFQGVFVHKDTPESIVTALTNAFEKAIETDEFKETLDKFGMNYLNINGDEAVDFIDKNRATSTWMVHDAGESVNSPEDFGIEKP